MSGRCPSCGSTNIRFRPKRSNWICDDCDTVFQLTENTPSTKVFVSYGHDFTDFVLMVSQKLQAYGIDVWTDSQIPEGASWRESITAAILESQKTVAFISRHTVRDGGVCLDELAIAVGCGIPVIPVVLEKEAIEAIPSSINSIQYLDFSRWAGPYSGEDLSDPKFNEAVEALTGLITSNHSDEQMDYLRRRLNQSGVSPRIKDLRHSYQKRGWIDRFISDWYGKGAKSLLLEAYPGAGKSFYCSHFFHYNPMTACLVFCDEPFYEKDRVTGIIKRIAFSLAEKLPEFKRSLVWHLNAVPRDMNEMSIDALTDYLITKPLLMGIDGRHPFSLVVLDGVDLLDENDKNTLVDRCLALSDIAPDFIGFLFTSRQSAAVNARFPASDILRIEPDSREAVHDINLYLRKELPGLSDKRYDKLARRCRGSFLYARILAGFIKEGGMDADQVQAGEIYRLYLMSMERIFGGEEGFLPWRLAASVLCSFDGIPVSVFCKTLGWNENDFSRFRKRFLSLTDVSFDSYGGKTISFVYPSFKAWLTHEEHEYNTTEDAGVSAMAELFLRTPVRDLHRYQLLHIKDVFKDNPDGLQACCHNREILERILQEGEECLSDAAHFFEAESYFSICDSLRCSEENPGYIHAVRLPYLRAKRAFLGGDYSTCARQLPAICNLLENDGERMEALYMLGTSYDIIGKRKESADVFTRLLDEARDDKYYVKALCGLLWNDHFNNLENARIHLEKLRQIQHLDDSEQMLKDLIYARYLLSGGNLKESLAFFERVTDTDANGIWGYDSVSCRNQMLLIEAVVAFFDNNQYEKGISIGKRILSRLEGHGNIAECYCSSWIAMNCLYDGLLDEAEFYLSKSKEMNKIGEKDSASAWMTMHLTSIEAFVEGEKGHSDKAAELHEAVLEQAEQCDDIWVAGDALFELFCLTEPSERKGSPVIKDLGRRLRTLADKSGLPHLDYKARVVEAFQSGEGVDALTDITLDKVAGKHLPSVDEVRAFGQCLRLCGESRRHLLEEKVRSMVAEIAEDNPSGRYRERRFVKELLNQINHER